jgi:dinuclear metal center YbgI/SA1388 family protein
MTISFITSLLEKIAPLSLQEDYDNVGLITGNKNWECKGALVCLDVTEKILVEAIQQNCNLIIAHHPIVFKGIKKFSGNSYVERAVIKAIKNDIAIYACHTNLDNIISGVNGKIADQLGLVNRTILQPKDRKSVV